MKIVSVMSTSARGGAEFAAVEMLDALAANGHEVVLVSDRPELKHAEMGREAQFRVRSLAIGPKLSTRTYRRLALLLPVLLRRLRRALEEEAPYDVLLVHFKKEQLLAALLPARLRAALVWAEWGPVPHPLRRGLPGRLFLAAARRAAAIIAVSDGTRRDLMRLGIPGDRVAYVPNVVRTDLIDFTADGRARVRAALGIPDEAFVVGCISRLHRKKRNDVVVRAVTRLRDERAHLVLAGEGDAETELRALAGPLDGRAHFLASVGTELADVLSAFDVSVFCPSPTEGQPRAVVHSMLARRPCVSTAREGAADLIGPNRGTIVTPENDPAALAGVLRSYIGDDDRRRREGETSRRWAEARFAAPVVGRRVEAVLRTACSRAR